MGENENANPSYSVTLNSYEPECPINVIDFINELEETSASNINDDAYELDEMSSSPKRNDVTYELDEMSSSPKSIDGTYELDEMSYASTNNDNIKELDEPSCDLAVKATKFTFEIPHKKWKLISICTNGRGERRLGKGWTEVFYKYMRKHNLTCPMVFKSNFVKKDGSRKAGTVFFTANAHCKFEGCVRYRFRIKRDPEEGQRVKVKVSPVKPYNLINHETGVKKSRFVAGKYRHKLAEKAEKEGASNTYYDLLGSLEEKSLKAGNMSGIGSKQVIQKIASEGNLAHRLHKDVMIEVAILKLAYEKEDISNGPIKGYVQAISFFPFAVTLYCADQINILAKELSKGTAVLYFDATGKVITKIPGQQKRVFYYALLLKSKMVGDPPIPVAELISNAHATVDIGVFLMRFFKDVHEFLPSTKVPSRVEVDFSWAMIHAVLLSCNRENISTYLKRAWDHLHKKEPWGNHTKVHICSAHVIHKISGRLSKIVKDKTHKQHILFLIAKMIDAKTFTELNNIFRHLAILLLSESETSHDKYADASLMLTTILSNTHETYEGAAMDDFEEEAHGSTPSTSVFARHFQTVVQDVNLDMTDNPKKQPVENNPYYCPEALKYICGTYMGVAPLWTGLLLEGVAHDTNSSVENWMKILKRDVLQGKFRMSPANFIIETRDNLKGRLREFTHAKIGEERGKGKSPRKKGVKRKKKNNSSFLSCEESWGGKKTKKKSVYFREPLVVDSERALHWGGKIDVDGRTVTVANTCPVDNLLVLLHFALNSRPVAEWFFSKSRKIEACRVLLEIHDLFSHKQWNKGREVWIKRYCFASDKTHLDLFGSEFEHFVKHFGSIQESESLSTCTKRRCPKKSRTLVSKEITLGQSASLQESIIQWENEFSSDCHAGPAGHRCKGERSCLPRTFTHGKPPVLIVNVTSLSESGGLKPSTVPENVQIVGSWYTVFGFTVGDGHHFKSFFRRNEKWYKYDGLCTPEVISIPIPTDEDQVEHLMLVLD